MHTCTWVHIQRYIRALKQIAVIPFSALKMHTKTCIRSCTHIQFVSLQSTFIHKLAYVYVLVHDSTIHMRKALSRRTQGTCIHRLEHVNAQPHVFTYACQNHPRHSISFLYEHCTSMHALEYVHAVEHTVTIRIRKRSQRAQVFPFQHGTLIHRPNTYMHPRTT
jgi:hypothetical protein